ncbi:MAG: FAD-binding oxidoreductase [Burkholderiales bacterium]
MGDIEIAWLDDAAPSPQHAIQTLDATVIGREQATHDITRLHLEAAGQPLTFSAGQYAELGFGGLPTRPYSMANIPGNGPLEFHIRQLQGGLVSNYVANELCVGDPVKIEGPYGSAQLRENAARPMLLVAGGSGLAPIKSILLAALALPWRGAIHLYHGVRDARDLYDVGLLSELASRHRFRFVPVLSVPATATSPHHGFVHQAIARDFASLAGFDVYIGGPPVMVEAATETAATLGAARQNIYSDPFYQAPRVEADRGMFRAIGKLFRAKQTQSDQKRVA